jgi:hypothetical protein
VSEAPHAPLIEVTEAELVVNQPMPGTPELAAMIAWLQRLGVEPPEDAVSGAWDQGLGFYIPVDRGVRRDVAARRIYVDYINDHAMPIGPDDDVLDLVTSTTYVQLEAEPPPWPREIARHIVSRGRP